MIVWGLENGEANVSFVYKLNRKLLAVYILSRTGKFKTDWCTIGIKSPRRWTNWIERSKMGDQFQDIVFLEIVEGKGLSLFFLSLKSDA